MATVKGDVHDIGKNIVGVVLGCNNYEVIDLGVMVPADKILQTAVDEGADMIGLSGLITPSLDEMVFVAREMERRGFTMPLLIGGATTSRQHTAVKIAPEFSQPVVHVLDASRAVDVVSSLLSPNAEAGVRRGQPRASRSGSAQQHAAPSSGRCCRGAAAQANRLRFDWARPAIRDARRSPARVSWTTCALDELVPYIDWTFFFSAWELKGRFPAILEHPQYGAAARELYEHARTLLDRIVARAPAHAARCLRLLAGAHATATTSSAQRRGERRAGPLPHAAAAGSDRDRARRTCRSPTSSRRATAVSPTSSAPSPSRPASARTSWSAGFEREHDDYNAIMVKALADRLAEAFAEYLHARARRDWGYGAGEQLTSDDLIAERYRGIRPAFGYPACPDHTEKGKLFDAARRGPRRHRADRELRDGAGGVRQRPLLRASRGALLHRRPHRPRSGRGLRAPQGHGRSPRSNAGSRPIWPTSRSA